MNRSFSFLIEPFFDVVKPRRILEIGCKDGKNTFKILDRIQNIDSELVVIDPYPQLNQVLLDSFKNAIYLIVEDISLNVLQDLGEFDLILIDGDHNYYTVYNELLTIEKTHKKMPIIFFHDTSWPYARRDLYYNPDGIPENERNEYSNKGIKFGESKLVNKGGINSHLNNALFEGGEKNGVLTAIEDFVKQSKKTLIFKSSPFLNGIGMLVTSNRKNLVELFDMLRTKDDYLKFVEKSRMELNILTDERLKIIKDIEKNTEKLMNSVVDFTPLVSSIGDIYKFIDSIDYIEQKDLEVLLLKIEGYSKKVDEHSTLIYELGNKGLELDKSVHKHLNSQDELLINYDKSIIKISKTNQLLVGLTASLEDKLIFLLTTLEQVKSNITKVTLDNQNLEEMLKQFKKNNEDNYFSFNNELSDTKKIFEELVNGLNNKFADSKNSISESLDLNKNLIKALENSMDNLFEESKTRLNFKLDELKGELILGIEENSKVSRRVQQEINQLSEANESIVVELKEIEESITNHNHNNEFEKIKMNINQLKKQIKESELRNKKNISNLKTSIESDEEVKRVYNTIMISPKKKDLRVLKWNYKLYTSGKINSKKFIHNSEIMSFGFTNRLKFYIALPFKKGVKNYLKFIFRDKKILTNSDLFDKEYYLIHNFDLFVNKINPMTHYYFYGSEEDREPSEAFNHNFYKSNYEDVTARKVNPVVHYELYGKIEGRVYNDAKTEKYINKPKSQKLYSTLLIDKYDFKSNPSQVVDVIVCVHNALEDVKECLASLVNRRTLKYNLIIVNDGSREDTTLFLEEFVADFKCDYVHHVNAKGYTYAANAGLRKSKAIYKILLNSDTIVTTDWIERMIDVYNTYPNTGIVGPLSNAASFQTVPEVMENGDWKVNTIPHGFSLELYSMIINKTSLNRFPKVPFVNGFCFMISERVVNKIGLLDEELFGTGYGEENDYCIRAQQAGFELRVADNCYIFHEKSKSFTHQTRKILAKGAGQKLRTKHSNELVTKLINKIKGSKDLVDIRNNVIEAGEEFSKKDVMKNKKIAYYLPVQNAGGGANSVVQEVLGLRELGYDVSIVNKFAYIEPFRRNYPHIQDFVKVSKNIYELPYDLLEFEVIVATTNVSSVELKRVRSIFPNKTYLYYVQDYEPYFYTEGSKNYNKAFESYNMYCGSEMFAKTEWIRNEVKLKNKKNISGVIPSINTSLYNAYDKVEEIDEIIISTMIRPATPRRNPYKTIELLNLLSKKINIKVLIFGCSEKELEPFKIKFKYENYGLLPQSEVPSVIRKSKYFLDYSKFQAFGRTGIEAMALGVIPILPSNCGTIEYAENKVNSLLIDTINVSVKDNTKEVIAFIKETRKNSIVHKCLDTAKKYNVTNALWSIIDVFNKNISREPNTLLLTNGKLTGYYGSSYIRCIIPIQDNLINNDKLLKVVSNNDYETNRVKNLINQVEHVVIQRHFKLSISEAQDLVDHLKEINKDYIFDIDDDLLSISEEIEKLAKIYLKNAFVVTVSTNKLLEELKKHNSNIVYLPNTISQNLYDIKTGKNETGEIIIGFFGTPSHEKVLKSMKSNIIKLKRMVKQKKGLDIRFEVVGITKINADWYNIMRVERKQELYPLFTMRLYEIVSRWELGIAALDNGSFSQFKSNLKVLEYAAMNKITVASDQVPFTEIIEDNINGILVKEDWVQRTYDGLFNVNKNELLENIKTKIESIPVMEKSWGKVLNDKRVIK